MNGSQDIPRYLLQYVLATRGICHENSLILALIKLKKDFGEYDPNWNTNDWVQTLSQYIDDMNIKLNTLNYKILKVSHGIGKKTVISENQRYLHKFEQEIELQRSNKYYVYVNLVSSEETKLATRFQEKEISFIKWAIEQFVNHGTEIQTRIDDSIVSTTLYKEVYSLISSVGDQSNDRPQWGKFITFTKGSSELSQYKELLASEIESLLFKLCDLKWFQRYSNGTFGMDLRCIAELQDYLTNEYDLQNCQYCHQVVLQGVMCGNEQCTVSDEERSDPIFQRRVWHLDCFSHYIQHVNQDCDKCQNSLIENGVYII